MKNSISETSFKISTCFDEAPYIHLWKESFELFLEANTFKEAILVDSFFFVLK